MADKTIRFGPTALGTSAANIYNPPANTYAVWRHIRFVNKTAGPVTFSAWLGATGASAAGTEVIGTGKSIPANDSYDYYGSLRMDVADFLTMLASAATSITVTGEGVLCAL